MFILDSGCGWIPEAPIKFMASIIDIIKVLTPVYLVIMGSIGFGKAIISQKEDEIKKAQSSFIKKIIAGAAVFFVIVFAEWITEIIDKVGGNTSGAMQCVYALLNNKYSADDKDYYEPPETTTTETYEICTNKCNELNNATSKNECQKSCDSKYKKNTTNKNKDNCFKECSDAGQTKEYCQKHCGDTPAGTWDSCMTPCLEAGQSEAYCTKHCDSYFNGGSNFNPTATTTEKNNSTTTTKNNGTTNNNNDEWNNCFTPCINAGQSKAYCTKHCETQLNGGSN